MDDKVRIGSVVDHDMDHYSFRRRSGLTEADFASSIDYWDQRIIELRWFFMLLGFLMGIVAGSAFALWYLVR